MFPDFLCIGAQKAGTTWLHENLTGQSEVWLPPVKEIHFLDHAPPSLKKRLTSSASHHRLVRAHFRDAARDFLSGRANLSGLRQAGRLAFGRRDFAWYEAIFPSANGLVCGEICPGYARMSIERIRAVHARNPRTRIVYLLRDPVDRAWSGLAMHFRKDGSISDVSEESIRQRLEVPKFAAHGDYARNISAWLDVFPREQTFFGFFDQIAEDPHGHLGRILDFLGIPASIAADDPERRVNAGKGEKMPATIERSLARALMPQAEYLHDLFGNAYTAKWLAHSRSAAGLHGLAEV